jgi:quinol monooxygenase YgiN
MIAVLGSFRLPLEAVDEATAMMSAVIATTLAEPGCRAYSYAEDVAEAGLFRVTEIWDSREALAAHFATPHMKRWVDERERLGFHDRAIAVHELGPAAQL